MSTRRSNVLDMFEKINLAQKISAKDKTVKEYTGSDIALAKTIALFNILEEKEMVEKDTFAFIKALLIEQNKATFWSSEKTDIFTKLGGYYPKREKVFGQGVKKRDQEAIE